MRDFAFSISLALSDISSLQSAGVGRWVSGQSISVASPCCPTVHQKITAQYALAKNPENLTARQREKLSELKRAEGHLARAWTLKKDLKGRLPRKGCA
ncbi:transposase [Atopobium sp. oral taxon 416]|uniref:transposase n=1 Tax=Atopobium sp. oral taxon 416 TaxID=712157 RepID=UPI003530543B